MAATLLETLTARGRLADRARAVKAAKLGEDELVDAGAWLDADSIHQMLAAASVEVPVARALGHRLVAPESMGMPLYALGMATPEKAYRRVQALLPREAPNAKWEANRIRGESARLSYQPHPEALARSETGALISAQAASCALRRGMLEAVPTLYGLLPATVQDEKCLLRGDPCCRYRIEWQRTPRRGLRVGGVVGMLSGVGMLVLSWSFIDSWQVSAGALFGGLLAFACTTAVGRVFDLVAQLEAVAGTRRGQLALFEQVDDQLAAKLDALARVDAKLETEPRSFRATRNSPGRETSNLEDITEEILPEPSERERGVLAAAEAIDAAAGDLECWFDRREQKRAAEESTRPEIGEERAQVREIRDWARRIRAEISPDARTRRSVDLAALVARSVASVRPLLPPNAQVRIDAEADLDAVRCEPAQIEQVVIQLVRNAIEASGAVMQTPEAVVSLRNLRSGVEIAVEDRGAGIDSNAVDEVFDPFFSDAPIGVTGGFGLPICLRIVQAHGGELRIEAEDRPGTRVSVFLPRDGHSGSDAADAG
jgi:signal transduction histidine kinase